MYVDRLDRCHPRLLSTQLASWNWCLMAEAKEKAENPRVWAGMLDTYYEEEQRCRNCSVGNIK